MLNTIIVGVIQILFSVKLTLLKDNTMKWLRNLLDRIQLEIRYRKKLKELRKRDPFIYK
jgi:hypothetical protein